MPFLRFARDKRGYEHTYLVHQPVRRGKPGPSRVLYWYRTPPGVKVGRPAFDAEARAAIELNNPGVTFDWKALEATPMPPVPEAERWRERRRLERMAKQARRAEKSDDVAVQADDEAAQEEQIPDVADTVPAESSFADDSLEPAVELGDEAEGSNLLQAAAIAADGAPTEPPNLGQAARNPRGRRRRRGGKRHGRRGGATPGGPESMADPTDPTPPPPSESNPSESGE